MANTKSTHPTQTSATFDWTWIVVVAAAALLARIMYAFETAENPLRDLLILDSRVYHLLALEIANENFWGSEVFFRAPLFPYLLGLIYKCFGEGQNAVFVFHALLGAATAVLSYLTARIHLNETAARITGIIVALYPTLYFFEATIMPTALEVFTFSLALFLLSRFQKSHRWSDLVYSGLALGVAALARPTILLFAVLLPIWLWLALGRKIDRHLLSGAALLFGAMAVVILPVTIRNFAIEPDLVLISSQSGANLYIGNNRTADGQTVVFPTGDGTLNHFADHVWSASRQIADAESRRQLTAAEVSSFWTDRTVAEIQQDWGRAISLFLHKLYLWFCGEEIFNNANPLGGRSEALLYSLSIWRQWLNFPYGLLAPLFLAGSVVFLWSKEKHGLLLLFTWSQAVAIALFFVSSRYRQPAIPAMIMVAVFAGIQVWNWIRRHAWAKTVAVCGSAIVLLLALNPRESVASKQNISMYHAQFGGALAQKERYEEAVNELRRAIVIADNNALAFQLLGPLYMESGQYEQALAVLMRAEELDPNSLPTKSSLARLNYGLGRHEIALKYFASVLRTDAVFPDLARLAAKSALSAGDTVLARKYIARALLDNPQDSAATRIAAEIGR